MAIILDPKHIRLHDQYDYYPTPVGLIGDCLLPFAARFTRPRILDIGAGDGVWGEKAREIWPQAHITGYELRPVQPSPAYD